MLDREVWPDEALAAAIAKNFVPLLIYDHKDKDTMTKYGVRAFPTFVVTDAAGEEEMRQVGAPFRTPADATEWFGKIHDGLENIEGREKAHQENPDDIDAALKLADTYSNLGRGAEALPIFAKLVDKLEKGDKRYVDLRLKQADAMMGTLSRENQAEVGKQMGEIYDEILPGMIKEKDDRAVSHGITSARIKAIVSKDAPGARKLVQEMAGAFPEHDRALEMKYFAAVFAQMGGDNDTAKAEFEAMVKNGPEDNQWVKQAKASLDRMGG